MAEKTGAKPFWKSKKWWMSIVGVAVTAVASYVEIPTEGILTIAGLILGFVFGEAYIDGKAVKK